MWPKELFQSLERSKIMVAVVLDREQDAVSTASAAVARVVNRG